MNAPNQPNTPRINLNPANRELARTQKEAQEARRGKIKAILGRFWSELKETYGKPLQGAIFVLGGGKGDQLSKKQEQKVEGFDQFMTSFWNEVFAGEVDSPRQSEQLQKALADFSLALALMSHFSLGNTAHTKKYFQDHGIEDCETLPHYNEMKEPDGPLSKAVMKVLELNGKHMKECHQLLDKKRGKMHFPALATEMFKWFKGMKNPKNRQNLKAIFKEMLSVFHSMREQNPHLKEFLDAVLVPMTQEIQKKQKGEEKERKLYEKHAKGVEQLFRLRTPEFKTALERLFALKGLSGKRLFAWAQTEGGKAFLRPFGVNADVLTQKIALQYLGSNIGEALGHLRTASQGNAFAPTVREDIQIIQAALPKIQEALVGLKGEGADEAEMLEWALEEITDAINEGRPLDEADDAVELVLNIMPEVPSKIADFLFNTPLGRKKARDAKVNFDSLKTEVEEKINSILEVLLHEFPEGKKATSLKELIEMMLRDEKITLAGDYERIIVLGNRIYEQTRERNQAIWEALEKCFSAPKEDALEQAKKALDGLKNNPDYREAIQWFDFLVAAMQGRLNYQGKAMPKPFREALEQCRKAYGDREEGFNRDYSQNIPGVAPKDCDFSKFDTPFDFEKLIELYVKGVSDSRLADIKREIETQILQPIMVELGILLDENAPYEPVDKTTGQYYVSQEDFEMAQQMKKSLLTLFEFTTEVRKPKEEEKKEEEKTKNALLNEDGEKFVKNIRSRTGALLKQEAERERKRQEKEEERKAKK
ncbi:hypothetical protein JW752_01875 [Candidatus Peregrinibacteria bacterium]|nr:hypothetical protein [Candidatus Peregrinibacteria bacterium]